MAPFFTLPVLLIRALAWCFVADNLCLGCLFFTVFPCKAVAEHHGAKAEVLSSRVSVQGCFEVAPLSNGSDCKASPPSQPA